MKECNYCDGTGHMDWSPGDGDCEPPWCDKCEGTGIKDELCPICGGEGYDLYPCDYCGEGH